MTALLDLALNDQGKVVNLQVIATRQSISLSYLEQIFSKLRRHGLVTSYRGPGGGYKIARPLEEINIAEIMEAVNGSVETMRCKGEENCDGGEKCLSHDLWAELNSQVNVFLRQVTIKSLVTRQSDQSSIVKILNSGEIN